MEHQKVFNLLNKENDLKFVAREWSISSDYEARIMIQEIRLSIIEKF